MTLEQQILSQWGKYGDWNAAGQDQVSALANLLRHAGVEDLSQFGLKARKYDIPGYTNQNGDEGMSRTGTAYDAYYGGKQLGFLGDINADGSYSAKPKEQTGGMEDLGLLGGNGDLLGWSAAGHGNTSFQIVQGPNGPVVVPVWGSSSAQTYGDLRGAAAIGALAAGGTFAGAGGAAGSAAQGGLQGAAVSGGGNFLFGNGDPDSLSKSIIGGAAAGAAGGGLKAYGAEQGWNPAVTKAATSIGTNVARGGNIEDAVKNAAVNSIPGLLSTGSGLTQIAGGDSSSLDFGGGKMDFASEFDPSLYDFGQSNFVSQDGFDLGSYLKSLDGSGWGNSFDTSGLASGAANAGTWEQLIKALGGGKGIATAAGGLVGLLSSQDQTQSAQRAPWEPAQGFLKQQIDTGQKMAQQYQAHPFNAAQQAGYANVGGLLDMINHNAPGLLAGFAANATGANNFERGKPKTLLGSTSVPGGAAWNPQTYGRFGS